MLHQTVHARSAHPKANPKTITSFRRLGAPRKLVRSSNSATTHSQPSSTRTHRIHLGQKTISFSKEKGEIYHSDRNPSTGDGIERTRRKFIENRARIGSSFTTDQNHHQPTTTTNHITTTVTTRPLARYNTPLVLHRRPRPTNSQTGGRQQADRE